MKKNVLVIVLVVLSLGGLFLFQWFNAGQSHAEKGMTAYNSGDYNTAITEFNSAIEAGVKEDQKSDIYTLLGNSYSELDELDEAVAAHQKALEASAENYRAMVNLGVVYRKLGKIGDAEKYYLGALKINPDYAQAHSSLGVLYALNKDVPRALTALKKAIKCDPQLASAQANIALVYAMAGNFPEAEKSLKQAVALGYKSSENISARISSFKKLQNLKKENDKNTDIENVPMLK